MTPSRHFTLYSSTVGSDGEVRTESTKRYVFLCSTRPNHSHTIGCQASHYLHEAGTCTLIHRKVVINSICKHTSSCSHLQLSHPDTCPRWKVGKIMLINITQCDHTAWTCDCWWWTVMISNLTDTKYQTGNGANIAQIMLRMEARILRTSRKPMHTWKEHANSSPLAGTS